MRVVKRIASEFYGVDFPKPGQTRVLKVADGEELLGGWLRKVGSVIASNTPAPFGLQRVAEECKLEFRAHLVDEIARAVPDPRAPNVLGRLLAVRDSQHWADERVIANLAGLMLAGSTALVNSFALALKQMSKLRRRGSVEPVLGAAITAARAGDDETLSALMFEAWRFAPTFPILVRYSPRETRIGRGASSRVVPAGAQVYVVPQAAMFDASVEDGDAFSTLRGQRLYLQFGAGPHTCLGREVATAELLAMFRAFLSLEGAERIEVRRIRYDGPAAHSLSIRVKS
jgi:cytochrome P450